MWSKEQIEKHRIACEILDKIKNEIFQFIRENKDKRITEYDVQQFIIKKFEEYDVENEIDVPIVGFNSNAAIPHYFPKKKSSRLKKDTLILIDIWAKLKKKDAPYSDITWMGYYGDVPEEVEKVFEVVIKARNSCLNFIKAELKNNKIPSGKEIDEIAKKVIIKNGYEKNIKHRTGHSIGTKSPHGEDKHVNSDNIDCLKNNLGYTIEPGVYLDGKFGVRSEINFYINSEMKLIVTTPMQKEIVGI